LLAALPPDVDPVRLSLPRPTTIAAIGTLAKAAGIRLADAGGPVELPEALGYEHRRH
jgi:thiamine-monophosphate kinase